MILRKAFACALFCCLVFATRTNAQTTNRYWDMKARVLNLVFPLDAAPPPYFWKIILRFSDPDAQIVVVVHPGGKSEVVSYDLAGMGNKELSRLILKMLAEDPDVTDKDLAAKLKVDVNRFTIDYETLSRSVNKLRAIRIPPITPTWICIDECPTFEYWYDDAQESVHYTIVGDFKDSPQNRLVQWMVKFREKLPDLTKLAPASELSQP
jgi:hypothetical protein